MKAFITGSQAYGTAHCKSDVDLVIVVDAATKEKLIALSDLGSWPIRFGSLNLVVIDADDEDLYKAWRKATKECTRIAEQCGTITKEKVIEIHERIREEAGVNRYAGDSRAPDLALEAHAARKYR